MAANKKIFNFLFCVIDRVIILRRIFVSFMPAIQMRKEEEEMNMMLRKRTDPGIALRRGGRLMLIFPKSYKEVYDQKYGIIVHIYWVVSSTIHLLPECNP